MLIAVGQPAWPAAVEFLAALGGRRVATPHGVVAFDPPETEVEGGRCAVGVDDAGRIWSVDESGALWSGGAELGDAEIFAAAYLAAAAAR